MAAMARATFTTRQHIIGSSGEIRVSNHDGISFAGTIGRYHQHSLDGRLVLGIIATFEGTNVRGNNQRAATFVMSVHDGGPAGGSDRVTLVADEAIRSRLPRRSAS